MNTLIALPTARTVQRLTDIFMSAPFGINLSKSYLPLWIGEGAANFKPRDTVYECTFTDVRSSGDEALDVPQLRGYCSSNGATDRIAGLNAVSGSNILVGGDSLYIVLKSGGINNSRPTRYFLSSIINTLVYLETEPFTFSGEMLVNSDDLL
jgi:hypothetical protein